MSSLPQRAAALVCGVADRDETAIRCTLRALSKQQLRDLAVWLARHVDPDVPFTPRVVGPEAATRDCIDLAATRYGTTPEILRGLSRHREHIDPRHVAAYAARLCGASYPIIGRALNRDHSTIMAAVSRVGENARLRAVGKQIADAVGRHDIEDEVA